MKVRKILSTVLATAIVASMSSAVFADTVPVSLESNVIYSEDFTGGVVHTNYDGKYVVNSGKVENEEYNTSGGRILYQSNDEISGGVIAVEATFNFSKVGLGSKIMSTLDGSGSNSAFNITTNSTGMMRIEAYDLTGNSTGTIEFMQTVVNTPYKIVAYIDMDSRRLQLAVNDDMVLAGRELYINKNNANISRLFDSDDRSSDAEYTIDDISAKRIAHLPMNTKVEPSWSEDFQNFATSNYTASNDVSSNIVSFSTIATDSENHRNVLDAIKGTRLLKTESSAPNGIYSIKADMYFTSDSVNGIGQKITDSTGNNMATQIRINGGYIGVYANGAVQNALKYELNKWYTVDLRFDTSNQEVGLYINGKRYLTDKTYKATECTDYMRLCDINNKSNSSNGLYLDNISVEKISDINITSEWKNVDKEADYNEGLIGSEFNNVVKGPIDASNGYAIFNVGNRALYQKDISNGVHSIEVDVRIPSYSDGQNFIFGTAGDSETMLYVYNVFTEGNNICATGYTENGTEYQGVILKNYDVNEWYNIRVTFDMSSKRVHFYVNDLEALTDMELYMGNLTSTIKRPYDFRPGTLAYHIDNLKFYEDLLLEALGIQSRKVLGNISLPATVNNNIDVAWITDDATTISEEGVVNTNTSTSKFPTLQAKVADGTGYATRRFTFFVPALELGFSDKTGVVSDINDLPFVATDGTFIEWTSSMPEIVTATGAVNRPAETTTVVLTAKYGDITKNYNIEVLGMNEEDKVFVCDHGLYIDGEKLSGKSSINGKTVTYKGKLHNATSGTIKASAILAVYKDNRLEYVDITDEQEIASKTSGEEFAGLSYAIPAEGNYSVKAMIWDMNTMYPYDNAVDSSDKDANLFVLSDSVYANYAEDAHNDEGGIGMYIASYLDDHITVYNEAHGGASTRSYMKAYFNEDILAVAEEGDYMLVSFGINDGSASKPERYTSEADYKKFLGIYVNAARDRGINVFFVTSTPTGTYKNETVTYSENSPTRREWMKDVAGQLDVKCLELGEMIDAELALLTPAEQYAKFIQEAHEGEGTMVHINKTRANELAGWLTQLIKEADINGLSGYVK